MPDVILQRSLRQDSLQKGDVHDCSLRSGSLQVDSSSLGDVLYIPLQQNDTGSQGGSLTQFRMLQLSDVKTLIRCSYRHYAVAMPWNLFMVKQRVDTIGLDCTFLANQGDAG